MAIKLLKPVEDPENPGYFCFQKCKYSSVDFIFLLGLVNKHL